MTKLLSLALIGAAACAPPPTPRSSPAPKQLTSLPGDEGQPVFSPDGSRIVFTAERGHGVDLALLELDRGELRWLTDTPGVFESSPAWTPDGTSIIHLARSEEGTSIRRYELDGPRSYVIVSPDARPARPLVSPKGSGVAFTRDTEEGTQIWTVGLDGSDSKRIVELTARVLPYAWSPDGGSLIVDWFTDGGQDIWLVDARSGETRRLTEHPDEEWQPYPSPDGARVAFYSTYGDAMTDLNVVELSTGAVEQLTHHACEDFVPEWSPDGRRLVFLSDRIAKSGLWLVEVATGDERPLLPRVHARGRPVWSPRGDVVAFQRVVAKERIYRIDAAGGVPEPVSPEELEAVSPVVSPDGGRILFHTTDFGSEADLATLELESGAVTPITREVANLREHSWSHDGGRVAVRVNPGGWYRTSDVWILDLQTMGRARVTFDGWVRTAVWCGDHVYFRRPRRPTRTGSEALWRVAAAGGDETVIHDLPGVETPTDCAGDGALLYTLEDSTGAAVRRLRVTDDGRARDDELIVAGGADGRESRDGRVAYTAVENGRTDLYVIDPASGEQTRLTDSPWRESAPDWSPDGRFIFFSATHGNTDLWLVDVPSESDGI